MVVFQLPPSAPCPRLCVVIKKTIDQEYGFNLHAEKNRGQFIGAIDADSPADIAGLRSGDRIFAVNGALIQGEPHKQVVQRIKENPLQCELLVITEEGAEWYLKNKIQITPSLPNVIRVCREWEDSMKPNNNRVKRLSHIFVAQNDNFFSINSSLILQDDDNNNNSNVSLGYYSALDGDILRSSNNFHKFSSSRYTKVDKSIQRRSIAADSISLTSSSLSSSPQIKSRSNRITFKANSHASMITQSQKSPKISDKDVNEENSQKNHSPVSNLLQQPMSTLQMAPRPRLCYLKKNDPCEEFGFNVHLEKGKGHYIGVVDYNGIAYHAGLETGQRIVGINGEIIHPNTPHKDVVTLIKRTPLESSLLVASEDVDKWYIDNNIQYSFDNCIYFKKNNVLNVPLNTNKSQQDSHVNTHSSQYKSSNARSVSCGSNRTNHSSSSSDDSWKQSQKKLASGESSNKFMKNGGKYCEEIVIEKGYKEEKAKSMNPFEESYDNSPIKDIVHEKTIEPTEYRTITPQIRTHSPVPIANCKPFGGNTDVNSIHINSSVNNNNEILKYSEISPSTSKSKPNMDIFSLSAKEAREMMALNRKKDPRKQNTMSIEQKYKLISSL
uniref:PDZ domain-containing protein n=1 Tax=Parastrongyloides trichosuri TaxID=131310 RepID=A0A0N5A0H8_PARTI